MLYRLFDLNIEINFRFDENKELLKGFLCKNEKPDISISVTDEEIENEAKINQGYSEIYYERICVFRHIQEDILDFDGIFFHGAVIEVDGVGYMLSGVHASGKSTQAVLWKEYFKDRATIVNGDKPILRFFDDGVYAYGSVWCGKEGLYSNTKTKLKSICFINKSSENKIIEIPSKDVLKRVLTQLTIPKKPLHKLKHFELLDRLIKEVKFYELYCDISEDAVITAYKGLK